MAHGGVRRDWPCLGPYGVGRRLPTTWSLSTATMTALLTNIDRFRTRLRRIIVVRGVCRVLLLGGGILTAAAVLDTAVHVSSPYVRLALLLAAAVACAWSAWVEL